MMVASQLSKFIEAFVRAGFGWEAKAISGYAMLPIIVGAITSNATAVARRLTCCAIIMTILFVLVAWQPKRRRFMRRRERTRKAAFDRRQYIFIIPNNPMEIGLDARVLATSHRLEHMDIWTPLTVLAARALCSRPSSCTKAWSMAKRGGDKATRCSMK
jgi:hypothetical protein